MSSLNIKKLLPAFLMLLILVFQPACSIDENKTPENIITKKSKKEQKLFITDQKIYGIKSGIIEYEITGSQTGTKKLYFDYWGRKQAEFTNSTIKVGKYTKHSNLLKITNGDWQYIINLENNTGLKRENPVIEKIIELKNQTNYGEFGEQLLLISGGFESGRDMVSGKKCKVYEFKKQNTKSWIWNWLMLKSQTKRGNINITVVAKKIEENVFIADTVFNPPKNILITEVDLESLRNQVGEN
ncbi:MAG: hypothetical protein IH852_03280 [Bacteroidetes bacterium]|nr:hypothetical protein [Bacteroidota bacterium]